MHKASYWILRLGLSLVFIWFGLDKLITPINWLGWVPGWVANLLPFSVTTFLLINGVIEIVLGLLLLVDKAVKPVSALMALFIIAVLINFGFDEVTIRDIGLLSIALALFFW